MSTKRKLQSFELSISEAETLRLLGLAGKKRMPRESLMRELEEELVVVRDLLEPRAVWVTKEEGLTGSARFSAGSPLALAVCTIGDALERRVDDLAQSGRIARAMILDAIGSAAVEGVADLSNGRICEEAIEGGHSPGPRRSPGYDRWPVVEQRLLFDLLEPEDVGVELNDACMMIPRKSVSFAVPLAESATDRHGPGRCARCKLAGCPYREA